SRNTLYTQQRFLECDQLSGRGRSEHRSWRSSIFVWWKRAPGKEPRDLLLLRDAVHDVRRLGYGYGHGGLPTRTRQSVQHRRAHRSYIAASFRFTLFDRHLEIDT